MMRNRRKFLASRVQKGKRLPAGADSPESAEV
jgi:hypothetical protein